MIILLGPPGSGKGTQAKLIEKKTGIIHYSAGDALKNYVKNNKELNNLVQQGFLLDSLEINEFILNTGLKLGENIILDGFPRTEKQCDFLISNKNIEKKIKKIFILEIDEEEIIKRISSRFICSICKYIYDDNIYCCNLKTLKREDDLCLNVVKNRFINYKKNIFNIKDKFFSKSMSLKIINANQKKELVFEEILKEL